ncbi:transposase [Microbacterium sp. LRZ72]|uniref:transposase n=1 Tax=Microbacterium sp. LRZ72 TaxID=2942481 RepID=UPI0029BB9EC2|nr:transposase [Microbacterium sp. LRZ72]MDX2376758.1 transposase [Microbacterium sp. LRZ72]
MPVKYSEEFKRDAVALVLTQGMSQKQVCADMGISKSALQSWVRNAELAGRGIAPAATGDRDAQREQAKMLKRIRELEMENEVLRKASAYLSQANLKLGSASPK